MDNAEKQEEIERYAHYLYDGVAFTAMSIDLGAVPFN
jgi:hypothetical protein